MILLIALSVVAVYVAGILPAARFGYRRMRPWTEPLSCATPFTCGKGKHYDSCYRRSGLIDTAGEAFGAAIGWGFGWPFVLPVLAIGALIRPLITSAGRELPAERDAKIRRMEREMRIGQ